jgi:diaminopimelate epimerase
VTLPTAPGVDAPTFVKGHGTGNDFVLLPDPDGILDLTDERVVALCDRRTGIGADGVLRVVRVDACPESAGHTGGARWFMDHRNADGSRPEMCGNGSRLFAAFLVATGLEPDRSLDLLTRGGLRHVEVSGSEAAGWEVAVQMGTATTPRARAMPLVSVGEHTWPAVGVLVPNPHAVVFVDDLDDAGDLLRAPAVAPAAVFPDGVNVEFVVDRGPGHLAMRVHERGVGETLSCGTGSCAVAWAARRRGEPVTGTSVHRIDVPGGTVHVTEHDDGSLVLAGPAVLVAQGIVRHQLWRVDA